MAGFLIGITAFALPLLISVFGLGRPRVVAAAGGFLALVWISVGAASEAAHPAEYPATPPFWFFGGLILLLYAIWCGGLWLGTRIRRMRHVTPG